MAIDSNVFQSRGQQFAARSGTRRLDTSGVASAGRQREERHHVQTLRVLQTFWVPCVRTALDETQTPTLLTNLMYYLGAPYLQSVVYAARGHGGRTAMGPGGPWC